MSVNMWHRRTRHAANDKRAELSALATGARIVLAVSFLIALSACGRYRPEPFDAVPFVKRAQSKSRGAVRVTAVVPSEEESARE